ncbi:MAG: substrate-binding periplasmic protein [Halodesulfovibrio sp.]
MKTKAILVLLATSGLFLLIMLVLDLAAAKEKLTVVCDIWPPYQIEKKDLPVGGFATDVVEHVLGSMQAKHEPVQSYPWKRAMELFQHGKADALFSANYTKEREMYAYYPSVPLVESPWVIWTQNMPISSLEDLKGKRIGVVTGYSYTQEFWEFILVYCTVEEVYSDELNFRKLQIGRLDALVAELGNGLYIRQKVKAYNTLPNENVTIKSDGLYIMFNRTTVDKGFVDRFSEELARFRQSKQYRDMRAEYFHMAPGKFIQQPTGTGGQHEQSTQTDSKN